MKDEFIICVSLVKSTENTEGVIMLSQIKY
jgi:hypothetical protein